MKQKQRRTKLAEASGPQGPIIANTWRTEAPSNLPEPDASAVESRCIKAGAQSIDYHTTHDNQLVIIYNLQLLNTVGFVRHLTFNAKTMQTRRDVTTYYIILLFQHILYFRATIPSCNLNVDVKHSSYNLCIIFLKP